MMKRLLLFAISLQFYVKHSFPSATNACQKGNQLSNYSCIGECDRFRVDSLGESIYKDFVCEVRNQCLD